MRAIYGSVGSIEIMEFGKIGKEMLEFMQGEADVEGDAGVTGEVFLVLQYNT